MMMMMTTASSSWILFLVVWSFICFDFCSATAATTTATTATTAATATTATNVTVIGLGGMGRAIATCLASRGHAVHVWNRGLDNRQVMREAHVDNITVYNSLQQAVEASNRIVIMVVTADRKLSAANSIIQSIPFTLWNDKTLVQYTTHDPMSIETQANLMMKMHNTTTTTTTYNAATVIGGAIVAVPHMVCSNHGTFLVSRSSSSSNSTTSQEEDSIFWNETLPVLQELGPTIPYNYGVGYAALAYFGLIQSLQFGLAGHELSLLVMKQLYGAPKEFMDSYTTLIQKNVPMYFTRFVGLATTSVVSGNYESLSRSFLPADAYLEILELHLEFCEQMGLVGTDLYLNTYLQVFRRVVHPSQVGPTAIVEYYHHNHQNTTMKPNSDDNDDDDDDDNNNDNKNDDKVEANEL